MLLLKTSLVTYAIVGTIIVVVGNLIRIFVTNRKGQWEDNRRYRKKLRTVTTRYQESADGTHGGHNYVDLGLPSGTLWATCNIGANNPGDIGSYFKWGMTTPFQRVKEEREAFDNPRLAPNQDAASVNWGGSWRMPSREEFEELVNNCKFERARILNSMGTMIVGPNGKSIFLPYTGFVYSLEKKSSLVSCGGYYWTSQQVVEDNENYVCASKFEISFSRLGVESQIERENKYYGLTVRPVFRAD